MLLDLQHNQKTNQKMKTRFKLLLILIFFGNVTAQHKGNYDQISRQNVLHSGNATIYNPTVQQQINKILIPVHMFL